MPSSQTLIIFEYLNHNEKYYRLNYALTNAIHSISPLSVRNNKVASNLI